MSLSDDHFEQLGPATTGQSAEAQPEAPDPSVSNRAVEAIRTSDTARGVLLGAHAAGTAGLGRELAKMCGKAGAAGAVVDGAVGGLRAAKHLRQGTIDPSQAAKHVGAEAGCGFVTSSSGTAGTIAVFMLTGSMGPAALAAGMGASMGSRYLYKQVVGETLPSEEDLEEMHRQTERAGDEPEMSDVGPGGEPGMEDIGPEAQESAEAASTDSTPDEQSEGPSTTPDVDAGRQDDEDEEADDGVAPWENIGPDA